MGLVVEKFLICDGCGEAFGVDNQQRSGAQHRKDAKQIGWKLIVGDGYKYGDYCQKCVKEQKYKK